MDEVCRKLLSIELEQGGIPEDIYHFLSPAERRRLVEREGRFHLKDSERARFKVVMSGGVFDVLHIGHIVALGEARKRGDFLVVAVARDEHIRNKKREPVHPQEYRRIMVGALRMVDVALLGGGKPEDLIASVKPDVIVYGYDQKEFARPPGVEIVKLEEKVDESRFKTGRILERFDF